MKLLLTGATGFIGRRLAARFLADGHSLAVLTRSSSDLAASGILTNTVTRIDFDGNIDGLIAALQAFRPDVVIHLASLFLATHHPQDVERLIESNIEFPCKLLEAMIRVGTGLFVNTGTSWQHYQSADYDPVNLYSATKQALEDMLTYYVNAHGLRAISLHLFDTYGPGDNRPKLFSLLRRTAKSGARLEMSPGEQTIDLLYIDDVVEAFCTAARSVEMTNGHAIYGLGAIRRMSLRELVAAYAEVVGRPLNIDWGSLPYRPRETLMPWRNYARLPGWAPRMNLIDGIRTMEQDPSIGGLLAK